MNWKRIKRRKRDKYDGYKGTNMMDITIGICAYNEEKNIGELLKLLLSHRTNGAYIKEIIIVSSACTDKTDDIINDFMMKNKRVKLIVQKEREGKASAVNVIIKNAMSDIIVLTSADVLPVDHTIDELTAPFLDKNVGMTGGHPIPVDDKNTFIGYAVHLIWRLHHELSLKKPKLGEIIAFRNILDKIPEDTAVDEASIEAIIKEKGLKLCYAPGAIVHNKGASTINDFLLQRRRIYAGHLHLKKNGYVPSSMSVLNVIDLVIEDTPLNLKYICWTMGAMCLELYARLLASYDFHVVKKNPYIWKMAHSTKDIKNHRNGRQGI